MASGVRGQPEVTDYRTVVNIAGRRLHKVDARHAVSKPGREQRESFFPIQCTGLDCCLRERWLISGAQQDDVLREFYGLSTYRRAERMRVAGQYGEEKEA